VGPRGPRPAFILARASSRDVVGCVTRSAALTAPGGGRDHSRFMAAVEVVVGRHKAEAECYLRDVMRPAKRTGSSKTLFEALYDRAAERLLVYLARRVRDSDAAAELWSECWAVAFESWPRCRASGPEEAEAWLFGVVRNQLAAYYRTGAIKRRALEKLGWAVPVLAADEREWIDRVVELKTLSPALDVALAELPQKRRQAVQLRVVEDLPYDAIAERLGCSEQTARAHVSRGLRRLERVLAPDRDGLQPHGGTHERLCPRPR
jgi:RNA polymerase sigma factor (sigma-70 family)